MLHCKMIVPALLLLAPVPALAGATAETVASDGSSTPPAFDQSTDALLRHGTNAYRNGDYRAAWESFRRLAARDVASAETMLGVMYARGLGAPRNDAVAAAWFLRAASRGYAPAQLALAHAFANGRGVKVDKDRAVALARAAAAQNQPGAAQLALREGPEQTAMAGTRR